jgi:hypothetical protein
MMQKIRQGQGFDVLPDGSIIIRCGTQTNCAGIVQIHFRIEPNQDFGVELGLSGVKEDVADIYSWENCFLSGANVPEYFRDAILTGVKAGYADSSHSSGIKFTLISAFVHPVDASGLMFEILGRRSFFAWVGAGINSNKTSWTFAELYDVCPESRVRFD